MPKLNTKQIILRINQAFLILLSSFILLNVIIFSLQIMYPAPSWEKLCSENICSENEHSAITNADSIYRYTIQKIFYILFLFLFFVALTFFVRKKRFSKYIILLLSLQSLLFAYFTDKGHQWYFEFGTKPSNRITSLFIAIGLAALSCWLYEFIKKIDNSSQNNDNAIKV